MIQASKCSCGGRLRKAKIDRVDMLSLWGLRGSLHGVPGLRCDNCREATFDGTIFDQMLHLVAREVLLQERILSSEDARFLRKSILGLTQEELSNRMGINKTTVADWERGERPLSKEHDYELRGISLANLLSRRSLVGAQRRSLTSTAAQILSAPRQAALASKHKPYVIQAEDLGTR